MKNCRRYVKQWKEYAEDTQEKFDKVVVQRNQHQREAQAVDTWRDVVKTLMEQNPELTKDQVNAMYDEYREANYEKYRAGGHLH